MSICAVKAATKKWPEKSVNLSDEHTKAMERAAIYLWLIVTRGSLGVVLYLILYGMYVNLIVTLGGE